MLCQPGRPQPKRNDFSVDLQSRWNTVRLLREMGLIREEREVLSINSEVRKDSPTWERELGRLTAMTLASAILNEDASVCLQAHSPSGDLSVRFNVDARVNLWPSSLGHRVWGGNTRARRQPFRRVSSVHKPIFMANARSANERAIARSLSLKNSDGGKRRKIHKERRQKNGFFSLKGSVSRVPIADQVRQISGAMRHRIRYIILQWP